MEEIKIGNKVFHKACFRCKACNKLLDKLSLNEHDDNLYCKICYPKIAKTIVIEKKIDNTDKTNKRILFE